MEDVNSPLQHYKEFNTIFSILRSVFQKNGNVINDEIISLTERLLPLDKTMELSAKAIIEIENLLYVQNNNSHRIIDKIVSDCILIEDWIEDIGQSNNLILGKKDANFYDLNTDLQDTSESKVFSELHFSFHFFYEPLINIVKDLPLDPNKPLETSQNAIAENLYPNNIFTSHKGYQIFKAFIEKEIKNSYADYSFLFNCLKADSLIRNLKHKDFMEFTDENYGTEFIKNGYLQFNQSSTKEKKNAYSRLLEQFK